MDEDEIERIATVIADLKATVERLAADNATLAHERQMLMFREVHRLGEGEWYVRGVEFGAPLPSREEAIRMFVDHLYSFWDWPSEKRRRKEEGWPDDAG